MSACTKISRHPQPLERVAGTTFISEMKSPLIIFVDLYFHKNAIFLLTIYWAELAGLSKFTIFLFRVTLEQHVGFFGVIVLGKSPRLLPSTYFFYTGQLSSYHSIKLIAQKNKLFTNFGTLVDSCLKCRQTPKKF